MGSESDHKGSKESQWAASCRRRSTVEKPSAIFQTVSERLYEKPSKAGQPPHHEATHSSIYERFAACTELLVVFAHPPVLVYPRKRPLHYPSTRQHLKALGGQ